MGLIRVAPPQRFLFYADQLDNPINSDWIVNSLAPAAADNTNISLTIRAFDDTIEEGVGFMLPIPFDADSIKLMFKSKARTAPTSARTVSTRLYRREILDNGAVGPWSSAFPMMAIDIPTNVFFQYDEQTIGLATLGLTPGRLAQFEFTRADAANATKLVGDWHLLEIGVEFV